MISFDKLFTTLARKHKTTTNLIRDKIVGGGTLQRIRDGQSVSTDTIDALCNALRCKPMDIMRYTPGDKPAPPNHTTDE